MLLSPVGYLDCLLQRGFFGKVNAPKRRHGGVQNTPQGAAPGNAEVAKSPRFMKL
jgi:hypothetical protein